MIVIVLSNCPPSLRGDLTKWMFEVSTNVFVGRVGSRVRDELWKRVEEESKDGRATMVFGSRNEQNFDFRVHNVDWVPADFDGLKLMLRPDGNSSGDDDFRQGYSKASKYRKATKNRHSSNPTRERYSVIDIKTTGPSLSNDEIIALSSLKVCDGVATDSFNIRPRTENILSKQKTQKTEITNDVLKNGENPVRALSSFIEFIGGETLISFNTRFDVGFLTSLCMRNGVGMPSNEKVDVQQLSKKLLYDLKGHSLSDLIEYFNIVPDASIDPLLQDCYLIMAVYEKLKLMR